MKLEGKVWRYGDNIDTDVIIPARYLNTFDPKELASHCMVDIDESFAGNVQEGDIIAIDIINHSIELKVSDEELEARRAKWVCPEPKIKTGYLARYAKLVSSADKGAILE